MKGHTNKLENDEEDLSSDDSELEPLHCWDCNVNFTNKHYLYKHLIHHIKQPSILLTRVSVPEISSRNGLTDGFEVGSLPEKIDTSGIIDSNLLNFGTENISNLAGNEENCQNKNEDDKFLENEDNEDTLANVCFSPTFADVSELTASVVGEASSHTESNSPQADSEVTQGTEINSVFETIQREEPMAPEPCLEYPKIRIKTTGLLKESLTITEITDENPNGDPQINQQSSNSTSQVWSLEDPLKLPEDDSNILSLFNNSERAKDLGFTTSDSEFISLERLDEHRGALQLYNPNNTNSTSNALESLTGLPMQALAQQVSRLQPSGNGMHQQNVLINIQQFPQAPPPQPSYQPPPMYHQPPHPQPMYQHYQYQPPNPYYPQPPGYPQHMPPPPAPPQPPLGPMGQPPIGQQSLAQVHLPQPVGQNHILPISQQQPPQQQQQQNIGHMQPNIQQSGQYRQPMTQRQPSPRQAGATQKLPAPRQPLQPRQPVGPRQRAPLLRPRGNMTQTRGGIRPRMSINNQNGQVQRQSSPIKRSPEQQNLQIKKKKFDVLTPDKDDDDCQVICMQPKNTDGGLPQIESVQGGQSETAENSIMHLSDSITLSVRNPPPKAQSPKKSDAKAVANILATRGITVTATAKPKEKETTQNSTSSLPSSLNLNGAVSIIPAGKGNGNVKSSGQEAQLPTVDLTDDTAETKTNSPQKQNQRSGLPFRCELCPAQYPNAMGLNKHRQNYHKTSSGMSELGIPLVNLKQAGIMQRLSSMGIQHYIPVPSTGPEGTFVIPVVNPRLPGNVAALGAQTMITLGPIRSIPKAGNTPSSVNSPVKQTANEK